MSSKQLVGIEAAKYVHNNMIVGLGTGSTVYYLIEELGRRVQTEDLKFIGVPTSKQTAEHARRLRIPLQTIDEVSTIDLTIDGADEVTEHFQGIKGGGAALLFEKIVATYSKKNIWIVDSTKIVKQLGAFPLPVEVIPYGSVQLLDLFTVNGLNPHLRKDSNSNPVLTDSGNQIIDLHLHSIPSPKKLGNWIKQQVGVVEHGLFLNLASKILVGYEDHFEILTL